MVFVNKYQAAQHRLLLATRQQVFGRVSAIMKIAIK